MDPSVIALLVFACTLGGALAGMWLRATLPEQYLSSDTKDTVKVGIGLVATMTALVLGLVTASAKSSFDEVDVAVRQAAAQVISLDRVLARYGAEAAGARQLFQATVKYRLELNWPADATQDPRGPSAELMRSAEELADQLRKLSPQNEDQIWLKSRALGLAESLLEARWVIFTNVGSSIPAPFLVVLVFWMTITFTSFGLFAPRNPTVIATFFLCALSVGSAVFLILELDGPFHGLLRISPDALRFAVAHMNQ